VKRFWQLKLLVSRDKQIPLALSPLIFKTEVSFLATKQSSSGIGFKIF
jgi:hypothetical protein